MSCIQTQEFVLGWSVSNTNDLNVTSVCAAVVTVQHGQDTDPEDAYRYSSMTPFCSVKTARMQTRPK